MQHDKPDASKNKIPCPCPLQRQQWPQEINAANHKKDRRESGCHGQLINGQRLLPTWSIRAQSCESYCEDRDHCVTAAIVPGLQTSDNQLRSDNGCRCSRTSARRPMLQDRLASIPLTSGGIDISATMKWSSGVGGAAASSMSLVRAAEPRTRRTLPRRHSFSPINLTSAVSPVVMAANSRSGNWTIKNGLRQSASSTIVCPSTTAEPGLACTDHTI